MLELDPLVNRPGDMDERAVAELREIIQQLRSAGGCVAPGTLLPALCFAKNGPTTAIVVPLETDSAIEAALLR